MLGESHYDTPGKERAEYTRDVVCGWAMKNRHRFFTVVSKILLGTRDWISDKDRAEVWHEVAFYNFVQEFVGEGARVQPTFRQWVAAQAPFRTVLEGLKPDAVLVLGYGLWEHVLEIHEDVIDLQPGVQVPARKVAHPASSRLSYEEAIPDFQNLIETARAGLGDT